MQNQKELDALINAIMEKSQKQEENSEVAETKKAPVTAPVSEKTADTRKQKMEKIKAALANASTQQAETAGKPEKISQTLKMSGKIRLVQIPKKSLFPKL